MLGIDAARGMAEMMQDHSLGQWPVDCFVVPAMREASGSPSVSTRQVIELPDPARCCEAAILFDPACRLVRVARELRGVARQESHRLALPHAEAPYGLARDRSRLSAPALAESHP